MNILGIETSCDESAAALVKDGKTILSSVVASQIEIHKPYSGVVPEIASRAHVVTVNRVIEEALSKFSDDIPGSIDAIGVTVGPGLVGSLLVGKMTAEALAWAWNKPVTGVNHIEGHLLSPVLLENSIKPPFLGLVVSGGHTELIVARKWGDYQLLGRTRDDAAGEAFDKVAKMLDLDYPGGPAIDRLAKKGRAEKCPFPRAWLPGTWDFSFSGLKTAVLYKLRDKKRWTSTERQDLVAGFQESVVDVLVTKSVAAAQALSIRHLVVGGGVAANSLLRSRLTESCRKNKIQLHIAPIHLCTDNAAMIASAAYFKLTYGSRRREPLQIQPNWHVPFWKGKLPKYLEK
jgi:N6-L-threonylcarbamoyladenine synthase